MFKQAVHIWTNHATLFTGEVCCSAWLLHRHHKVVKIDSSSPDAVWLSGHVGRAQADFLVCIEESCQTRSKFSPLEKEGIRF